MSAWDFLSAVPVVGDVYSGYRAQDMANDAARAQRKAAQKAELEYSNAYNDISGIYDPFVQTGATSLQQLMAMQSPEMGQFEYNRDIGEFMAPDVALQQQAALEAVQQGFGARGALNSSAAQKAMQRSAAQIQAQAYKDAYERQRADKADQYQMFRDRFAAAQQATQDRRNTLGSIAQMGYGASGSLAGARQDKATGIGKAYGLQGEANAAMAQAPMNALQGWGNAGKSLTELAALYYTGGL